MTLYATFYHFIHSYFFHRKPDFGGTGDIGSSMNFRYGWEREKRNRAGTGNLPQMQSAPYAV